MAADYDQKPLVLIGSGLVFFANDYIGHITRFQLNRTIGEVLGRYRGHVVNTSPGARDVTIQCQFDDMRPSSARYNVMALAAEVNDLDVPPSCEASAQFENMEPLRLLDSSTAVTLSCSDGKTAVVESVHKKDFSELYVEGTDYTTTSATLTRIGAGSIDSSQEVFVAYRYEDTDAVRIPIAKGRGFQSGALKVVMLDQSTSKLFIYEHDPCSRQGDFSFAVGFTDEWGGFPCAWRAKADLALDEPYGSLSISSVAVKSIIGG